MFVFCLLIVVLIINYFNIDLFEGGGMDSIAWLNKIYFEFRLFVFKCYFCRLLVL